MSRSRPGRPKGRARTSSGPSKGRPPAARPSAAPARPAPSRPAADPVDALPRGRAIGAAVIAWVVTAILAATAIFFLTVGQANGQPQFAVMAFDQLIGAVIVGVCAWATTAAFARRDTSRIALVARVASIRMAAAPVLVFVVAAFVGDGTPARGVAPVFVTVVLDLVALLFARSTLSVVREVERARA